MPLTDFVNATQTSFPLSAFSKTNRYIIGPTVELRLPAGFGVEFDALFRHFNYQTTTRGVDTFSSTTATSNAWEFPLLLKYRFPAKFVRPYVDGGVAWDRLQGLSATITQIGVPFGTTTTTTSNPQELKNTTATGVVIGGGLDIHAILIHISPEVRYTRWTAQHFNLSNVLNSNQNQAEFLLGITF